MRKIYFSILYFSIVLFSKAALTDTKLYQIKISSPEKTVILTGDEVDKLKKTKITTKNSWANTSFFEGVSLKDLLSYLKMSGKFLHVHAINDYWVEIPYDDLLKFNPILAQSINGRNFTSRDFGPYWIIYPVDDFKDELNKPIYGARSIWQVDSIKIY